MKGFRHWSVAPAESDRTGEGTFPGGKDLDAREYLLFPIYCIWFLGTQAVAWSPIGQVSWRFRFDFLAMTTFDPEVFMVSLRLRYQTLEFGETDIHVRTLRDKQQYADGNAIAAKLGISSAAWPLFGVIWAAGEVLARVMSDYEIKDRRILEVGCGIGLASLVLNHRLADITATDHHPEAEAFLAENVRLNNGPPIPFIRTGWTDEESDLGRFDLIIGSDLLYEQNHVHELAAFIHQHASQRCEVIIVDPGRGHGRRFCRTMAKTGFSGLPDLAIDADTLLQPFKGTIMHFIR